MQGLALSLACCVTPTPIWGEMLSKVGSPSPLFRSYCITGGQGASRVNPAVASLQEAGAAE